MRHGVREALAKLLSQGASLSEAARVVGVNRQTAKRWRNGRVIRYGDGRLLNCAPVINTPPQKTYSARYLSEEERLRLADLRREKRTMRDIARLLGRSPSTVSRELRLGSDAHDRYRPHEAHRRALARRRVHRRSRLSRDEPLRTWVTTKLMARWSPEQISRGLRQRFEACSVPTPAAHMCAWMVIGQVIR